MDISLLVLILTALFVIGIAIFVYLQGRARSVNRVFSALCLVSAAWVVSIAFDRILFLSAIVSPVPSYFAYALSSLILPTLIYFFLLFPKKSREVGRRILVSLYLPGLFFSVCSFTDLMIVGVRRTEWGMPCVYGPLYPFFGVYFVVYLCLGAVIFVGKYRRTRSPIEKLQMKYLATGLVLSFSGATFSNLIYPLFFHTERLIYIGPAFPFIFIPFVLYTIIEHRLMDIRIIIKKSLVYSVTAGLITSVFILSVLGFERLFREYTGYTTLPVAAVAALIIAFTFYPLKNKVQRVVDKYFYKGAYDYQQVMRDASKAMTSILDLEQLLSYILTVVTDSMKIERGSILLREPKAGRFRVKLTVAFQAEDRHPAAPRLTWQDTLVSHLRRGDEPIVREEMERILPPKQARTLSEEMKSFKADVAIPMMRKDRLIGIILLGPKLSGDIYSGDDLQLLSTLANQSAIAIRNAWLYSRLLKDLDTIRDLEREKAKAERLASLGTMAAGIAHEIKNPLVSIKTFAQLLPEKSSDPEFRNIFSDIAIKEIDRIDSLVLGLLSLAKPSPPNLEPTNVNSVLDETLTPMAVQIAEREIELTKEYQVDIPLVMADSAQLQQVFSNIIMNSIQATPERGRIDVVTSVQKDSGDEDGYVQIKISDTGIGVGQEELDKIFNPFFTTKHEGVGLGLTICHRIIEDHRGKIRLESKEGVGTTFVILLPAAESEQEAGEPD